MFVEKLYKFNSNDEGRIYTTTEDPHEVHWLASESTEMGSVYPVTYIGKDNPNIVTREVVGDLDNPFLRERPATIEEMVILVKNCILQFPHLPSVQEAYEFVTGKLMSSVLDLGRAALKQR